MTRVLLVCPEPLGTGRPAGIGIRFLEMARALIADGHRVNVLTPDAASVQGCESGPVTPAALRAATSAAECAVVQGHIANELFSHGQALPTVVDLYDPYIIENLHYFEEKGPEVFRHDHATLLTSLRRGDFFLCASQAQRLFYLGLLLALGRVHPLFFERDPNFDTLIAIAPFGVQPSRDVPRQRSGARVLFGGIYDWYDPIAAIEAVAATRRVIPDATLTFTRHPNAAITPQGKLAEAMAYVARRGYDFVRFDDWRAYDDREEMFASHAVALLTFPQSIETDLSMRTRLYDYLWAGLPIVTSPAPGTDELLSKYGAGITVADGRYAEALIALLGDASRLEAMSIGARRFADDHPWQKTLAPLLEFCRAPRFDETKSFAGDESLSLPPPSLFDRFRRKMGVR